MFRLKMQSQVIRLTRYFPTGNVRCLHSTVVINAGMRWRQRNNLPKYNNEYGPLRDTPDYSFKDGRPIPLTDHQIARKKQQIHEAKTVIQLLSEIDYTVERSNQLKKEEKDKRQNILLEKLKPKGNKSEKYS